MKFISCLFLLFASESLLYSFPHAMNPDTHVRRRVIIVGIDGLGGQELQKLMEKRQKELPHWEELLSNGASNLTGKTGHSQLKFHVTQPGWTQVLSGVPSEVSLVMENGDGSRRQESAANSPSFLQLAKSQGLHTFGAGVANFIDDLDSQSSAIDGECLQPRIENASFTYHCEKNGLDLSVPLLCSVADLGRTAPSCNLTHHYGITSLIESGNAASNPLFHNPDPLLLALNSAHILGEKGADRSDVMFGVFDHLDSIGHHHGFIDNPQYEAYLVGFIHHALGTILRGIQKSIEDNEEEWLLVLTSDHGGHNDKVRGENGEISEKIPKGGGHGGKHGESTDEIIPYVVAVLAKDPQSHVVAYEAVEPLDDSFTQRSVFPMVLHFLGLDLPKNNFKYDDVKAIQLLGRGEIVSANP